MDYNERQIIAYLSADRGESDRAYFDLSWMKKAHRLLMLLLSVRTRNPKDEREDFVKLFQQGERSDLLPDYRWPTQKAVLRDWRMYRDMTRELVRARGPVDGWGIAERYPADLVAKVKRLPRDTWKREIFYPLDPLDVMWVAWTYGRVNKIDYRKCATDACERYAAVTFPKRAGRQPRYCAVCNAATRDKDGHRKRKKEHDDECWQIVSRALERLPQKERAVASDEDRRRLANKLFRIVKKDLTKIPGKRGARWIAKKLKGVNHEQN